MIATNTSKVIFTGTRTDPQIYKYEEKLIALLRERLPPGLHISLHTNGLLAAAKMHIFNMYDSCTISINSFNPTTYQKLHGTRVMPDLAYITENSKIPIKLSCVVTEDNHAEVDAYIYHARQYGIKRIAFRYVFGNERRWDLFPRLTPSSYHCANPVYNIDGVEVTHWIFDKTSGKSINLFSDGTLSEEYLLVKAPVQNDTQPQPPFQPNSNPLPSQL
jgi:MoaA/NifB/PqqE/SkfB family radical SAM enzyme